ncbi:MAG TPA: formate dehydrogenase accessory sulfurtransferase FdhD [Acidobacteriota bacterium]|nr:formate dehydrogenase accessory sulfurtransferase FdhD [Acidobacteriota bacterium]
MREVDVVKIDVATRKSQKIKDYVAEEKPLHIFLNNTHYVTIFCSPQNLKELAVGHLLSEGLIRSIEEIEKINFKNEGICEVTLKSNIDLEKRLRHAKSLSRIILSACGGPYQPPKRLPKVKSNLKVKAEVVQDCVNKLNFIAETFRKTGGVHAAAIYESDGTLIAFAEDVGRHNAVDKVIGLGALNKTDFSKCFLALSGRLTGDIVSKAARVGLPIVASLAAAVDSGISVAKEVDLTLIGFVRGKRMNVYNCEKRIAA